MPTLKPEEKREIIKELKNNWPIYLTGLVALVIFAVNNWPEIKKQIYAK